ncbi:MAG: TraR/DksA family transcriptional regulator [Gemmataceae bacterium]|nr:TraR/DksA family transcriptional regulator [Gemmataceae bacterium]
MARKDALLRLHKTLLARRAELMKRLGMEMRDLGVGRIADQAGDSADAAFDAGNNEISSQLAEIESRELQQVNRALMRLKEGTYGLCEICGCRIPVARLNALPYSTTCIKCQREMEEHGDSGDRYDVDWDRVADVERRLSERRDVDLSDIEMDLSR